MIPQFILDNVFEKLDDDVYFAKMKNEDSGWVIYWAYDHETFHTYRYPPDWYGKD